MKTTFKLICFALVAMGIMGCAKSELNEAKSSEITTMDAESAKREFAKILSKAVSNEESLRIFIKNAAEKRFDLDYDVFYPFVKNQEVTNGRTFRDILISYCEDISVLEQIEIILPTLNILVPDWQWLGCFSIKEWNPSDKAIAVGYNTKESEKPIYADGEQVGTLPENALPGFPTIIVKCNERMKVTSPATKGGEVEYAFADESFDASLYPETNVEHRYYDVDIDGIPDVSNFVPASKLNQYVIGAYNEFNDNPYAAHRDYIYYGMTNEQTTGKLNYRINEVVSRIKLSSFYKFDDIHEEGDFSYLNNRYEYKENDAWSSAQQLRNHFYADGNIELNFIFTIAYPNGSTSTTYSKKSFSFGDLFAISHANLEYRHKTWFCKDWFIYTIKEEYVYPKWCDVNYVLPKWNIGTQGAQIRIIVEEWDAGKTYEQTYTDTFKKLTNFSGNLDVSGGVEFGSDDEVSGNVNIKVGLGGGVTKEKEIKTEYKISYTDQSDQLGNLMLDYVDPVLLSKTTKNGVPGYLVKTYEAGNLTMMIIPTYE